MIYNSNSNSNLYYRKITPFTITVRNKHKQQQNKNNILNYKF